MIFRVESYPNKQLFIFSDSSPLNISISRQVKDQLERGEYLTNSKALQIFKQMKRKADLLSFLTQPLVSISTSTLMFMGSRAITSAVGVNLIATTLLVGVSGCLLGCTLQHLVKGTLTEMSKAYAAQSVRLSEYITQLEENQLKKNPEKFRFVLIPPSIFSC